MESPKGPRVLVFGVGRSGTTWAASILAATGGVRLFMEPDHSNAGPHAVAALRGRGPTLVLGAGDTAPRRYEQLWAAILGDGPPRRMRGRNAIAHPLYRGVTPEERLVAWGPEGASGSLRLRVARALGQPPRVRPDERVVAKTAVGLLAIEWIVTRFRPRAVWIRRHPLDVVAGRHAMAMRSFPPEHARALEAAGRMPAWCPPPPPEGGVAGQAWRTGLGMSWCRDVVGAHDDILEVSHEDLCRDPQARFSELAGRVGLEWTEAAADRIRAEDRPGAGWSTERVTAAQSGKWRTRLDADEQRVAIEWLRRFPIAEDYDDLA